jgi:hypothetical protein
MLVRNTKVVTFVFEIEPKFRTFIESTLGAFLEPITKLRSAIVYQCLQPVRVKA